MHPEPLLDVSMMNPDEDRCCFCDEDANPGGGDAASYWIHTNMLGFRGHDGRGGGCCACAGCLQTLRRECLV